MLLRPCLQVFRVQYPASDPAKVEKRGQTAFHNEKKDQLRELLLSLGPKGQVTKAPTAEALQGAHKALNQMSLFGNSVGMVWHGMEKWGLPTLRFQCHGSREIVYLSIDGLRKYCLAVGLLPETGEKLASWASRAILSLQSGEAIKQYVDAAGEKILRGVVQQGSAMYMPYGAFTVERVLGDVNVIGLRISFLEAYSNAFTRQWQSLKQITEKQEGSETPVCKFWSALDAIIGGPDALEAAQEKKADEEKKVAEREKAFREEKAAREREAAEQQMAEEIKAADEEKAAAIQNEAAAQSNKRAAEKQAAEKAAQDKKAAEKKAAERAAEDKKAAEKAAEDKKAAEKKAAKGKAKQ
jgi:hypothetical protein